jgi:hypothetical protein
MLFARLPHGHPRRGETPGENRTTAASNPGRGILLKSVDFLNPMKSGMIR